MDRSDIITTLSSSSFYLQIMQKHQTGRKNTSRFPTMIFFKKRGYFFPKNISMILNFRLYLNQQNIAPVLILRNIPVTGRRISGLNAEKKSLQSIFKLKNVRSTDDVPKIFLTSSQITQEHNVTSKHFLTEDISANKTSVFLFLKSVIFKAGNAANNSNKILNSLFSPANSAFYPEKTFTSSPDIFTPNSKILSYENNIEILNSHYRKKIWYRWLNTAISPTFVNKENALKFLTVFENESSSNYSGKQNTISSFIHSIAVKNISVAGKGISGLNAEKKVFQSTFQINKVQNTDNVPKIFLTSLKIPQECHLPSDHFLTRNFSSNKILFFLFLKSLTFKAGNVTNNSNNTLNTLNSVFSPLSSVFHQQKTLTISPYILTRNSKILSYKNNMEIFNSQIAGKKICYKLLNIAEKSTLIGKENKLRSWPVSENKLPLSQSGNKNTVPSFIPSLVVKNTPVIKEFFSWLNTEKNCLISIARQKDALNANYTSNMYVSQAAFKIPQGFYEGAEFFLTENTFTNKFLTENIATKKNSVFSLLKPFIFRAKNITNNSNKILKSSFLPENHDFDSQKTLTVFPDVLLLTQKTGRVRELLLNAEKRRIITVIGRYFDRFRPFRFSTVHTRHDPFLKYLVFKAGNKITNSNRILKPQLRSESSIYHQPAANPTYSEIAEVSSKVLVSSHILNSKINEKILNSQVFRANKNYESLNITRHPPFFNKKSVLKNQSFFKDKLSAVFLQDNFLSNKKTGVNRRFFKESHCVASNEPLINNYYGISGHRTPGYVQSNHNYKMRPENLVFQNQGHIEQEIEQIKRIIIETKKSVSEKTVSVLGEAEIKKYLDINRISSQVYQNIERTIRMERERRGV